MTTHAFKFKWTNSSPRSNCITLDRRVFEYSIQLWSNYFPNVTCRMSSLIRSAVRLLSRACPHPSQPFRMVNSESVHLPDQVKGQSQQNEPPIQIGETTVKQLKRVLTDGEFLRVSVDSGGCKGFNYVFKLDTQLQPDDLVFERDKVKVVVDQESIQFLKGSTIEYSQELIRSAFRIQSNPQMKEGCSCGASFAPKF